ncbi:MAG: hypothetical protein IJ797_09885 [Selenomonadaceae bacterium]|nr:hypothetical protein [Selenomonadaceae bacterium]
MKIWAHRGCSLRYPENTLKSFEKAGELTGLMDFMGIELDIQLTKDKQIVVCHDEKVDRTTDGSGYIKDYTLSELKKLRIAGKYQIPTMEEVFDLLLDKMKLGLKLNIELKNSNIYYDGMEESILNLAAKKGWQNNIIYSSFYTKSVEKLRHLDSKIELGIIDRYASDCLYKIKGGCGANAIHPLHTGIDLSADELSNYDVRAWFTGHLWPELPTGNRLDLQKLESKGITDVFLNEPEIYV